MSFHILRSNLNPKIKGILFDMDGLVLDSECLYTRFWREAVQKFGYPMTEAQALGMRSINNTLGQKYLTDLFGPDIDYHAVRALRIQLMDAWIDEHGVQPKPGIRELLAYLHTHEFPCAITTSSPLERAKRYLTPLGLYEQFDEVCSGHDVAYGKPYPDIYLRGASRLRLAPENCLALEDSPAGIESAFRAGCLPVVIPDLDQPDDQTLQRCFARADTLSDICSLLDSINQ